MAVRPIRLFGDPVLRETAVPVTDFDKDVRRLVRDLEDTMLENDGAGLAAPQIGVGLRVFTYHVDDVVGHVVNPTIVELSEEEQDGDEGCLSFPGLYYPCKRAQRSVVSGFDSRGEPLLLDGSDMMARCLQHEIDHLDGILFIDRLDPEQRKLMKKALRDVDWAPGKVKVSPHRMFGTGW